MEYKREYEIQTKANESLRAEIKRLRLLASRAERDALKKELSLSGQRARAEDLQRRLEAVVKVAGVMGKALALQEAEYNFDCPHYEPPCNCAKRERELWEKSKVAMEDALTAARANPDIKAEMDRDA